MGTTGQHTGARGSAGRYQRSGARAGVLGTWLPRLTKPVFERYGFATASLITDWEQIVGPKLAAKCQPTKLQWPRHTAASVADEPSDAARPGGRLILNVEPAFALEIQYSLQQIAARINSHFGYRAVSDIRIVQSAQTGSSAAKRTPMPATTHAAKVAPEGTRAPQADLPPIENDRVRDALSRLAESIQTNKQARLAARRSSSSLR